jgi:hypothetical protein
MGHVLLIIFKNLIFDIAIELADQVQVLDWDVELVICQGFYSLLLASWLTFPWSEGRL